MTVHLSLDVIEAAKAHARAQYPKESCGLVVANAYWPCRNIAEDPFKDFIIDPADRVRAERYGPIQHVIHSHPNGPLFPTQADMASQVEMGVPWAIVALDEDRCGIVAHWGDTLPVAPLVGRQFVHGTSDCYTLLRDVFRLGKDKLAEQDFIWPYDPITLPEVPRDDNWWVGEHDLYSDHIAKFGFREIAFSEARPGDVFLNRIHSKKLNHAGVLLGNHLIAHHLPEKLSMRTNAGVWARCADMWIRYVGEPDA